MKDEIVKIDNLKLVLRYLNLEEFNDDRKYALDDEYTKNIGKVIYQETLELDKENPFEKDWSTEFIKQNNSIVETHTFPKFYKENDEIKLSNPGKSQNLLLRLYFGINNIFFDQKIKVMYGITFF